MRQPVPAGVIPESKPLSPEDEQYGHEVLSELTEQFPLDQIDSNINRVRDIVDKLTSAIGASNNPWHVYVLKAPQVKNAAATKGNHIFVWSGMLDTLKDDNQLSVVIAHEIAHVLAEHAKQTSGETSSQLITQLAGAAAQNAAIYQGSIGAVADLAGLLTQQTITALIINPESQRKELEADIIGMHLLAEAKIDPRTALAFWERNLNSPDFDNGLPQFLSSHPSSNERLDNIRNNLSGALKRFERADRPTLKNTNKNRNEFSSSNALNVLKRNSETWIVVETPSYVYSTASEKSKRLGSLHKGSKVNVVRRIGRWLQINNPDNGFVLGPNLSPQ